MPHIVILGGSYAGLSTAHRILKQQKSSTKPIKITVVTPNSHHYWNIAAPRGLVPGSDITSEQLFQPIAPGFAHYGPEKFELILGTAESLDSKAQSVTVAANDAAITRTISYDYLIIATGTHPSDSNMPFKPHGLTEGTKKTVSAFRERVEAASDIVVGGAGVTGIEIAGQLGYMFGGKKASKKGEKTKKIILICSGPRLLPEAPESVSNLMTQRLEQIGVEIVFQTRVEEVSSPSDSTQKKQKQQLKLTTTSSSASSLSSSLRTTDMYISTVGLNPNTAFLPSDYLNETGFVEVDEHLVAKGLVAGKGKGGNKTGSNVFAIGDCNDIKGSSFLITDKQSAYMAGLIVAVVGNGKKIGNVAVYKGSSTPMMGLSIGPDFGTGFIGSWKLPGFMVVWLRKNMFVDRMAPMVDGSAF